MVTGPRLLKTANWPASSTAPTLNALGYSEIGSRMLAQNGPSLPAEATTKMPAARKAATAGPSAWASQPSSGGQPHELLMTSAAFDGSPDLSGSPACGQGASINSMHRRY